MLQKVEKSHSKHERLGSHSTKFLGSSQNVFNSKNKKEKNPLFNYFYYYLFNVVEIESHLIEKESYRAMVCGRFRPADVAIKLRKKMNRRVEILEIQELEHSNEEMDQRAMIAF